MIRSIPRRVIVGDFESDMNKVIHTIALRAMTFGTAMEASDSGVKTRSGRKIMRPVSVCTTQESVVIKITDYGQGVGNVAQKHAGDVNTCIKTDFIMLFMPFHEAVPFMHDFIDVHGGTLISHRLDRDLDFLVKSQDHFGGKRVVKKTLNVAPKTSMYDKRWEKFTLVCSQALLCTRCPKFMDQYLQSNPKTTKNDQRSPRCTLA